MPRLTQAVLVTHRPVCSCETSCKNPCTIQTRATSQQPGVLYLWEVWEGPCHSHSWLGRKATGEL